MSMKPMKTSTCRGCGRKIIWIQTAGGKSMPCDPEEVTYWKSKHGTHKIVTPNGEVVTADIDGFINTATGIGFISHFATCPEAGAYRRK